MSSTSKKKCHAFKKPSDPLKAVKYFLNIRHTYYWQSIGYQMSWLKVLLSIFCVNSSGRTGRKQTTQDSVSDRVIDFWIIPSWSDSSVSKISQLKIQSQNLIREEKHIWERRACNQCIKNILICSENFSITSERTHLCLSPDQKMVMMLLWY